MAEKMQSINDLMLTGLSYVLDFENRAATGAEKMAQAASNPEAKEVFNLSASKGKEYAERVRKVFDELGKPANSNENPVAKAMLTEVDQMIAHTDSSPVRDAALIVAANQMQHYRVAVYGSLKQYAQLLGKDGAIEGLEKNLEESKGGDAKLTRIAEEEVNRKAAQKAA